MNIVVIGLGSMGKRRIRLLKRYIEENGLEQGEWRLAGVDSSPQRCQEAQEIYGIETYRDIETAMEERRFDCSVISTSPLSHAGLIRECLEKNLHVFTELNLVMDGYEENTALARGKNRILFLSSTFLYRKEMEYIKDAVASQTFCGCYRYHIGQYLPDWHPWEDYQKFFISKKRTNGCREILAIELPWLTDVFGGIKHIHTVHKKASKLNIPYDDMYHLLLEHESGVTGNLAVDVVCPKTRRDLELWDEMFYIEWKGTPDSLKIYDKRTKEILPVRLYEHIDHMEGYSGFVVENAYYDELVSFLEAVKGIGKPRYSFERDQEILSWIDRIEGIK